MITLPTLNINAPGDVPGLNVAPTITEQALPENFLTLLGDRLLTLTDQSGFSTPVSSPFNAEEKPDSRSEIPSLLASLDTPEMLQTLLTHENAKAPAQSADDKEAELSTALTESNKQALQALFAMLPAVPPVMQTPLQTDAGTVFTQHSDPGVTLHAGLLHTAKADEGRLPTHNVPATGASPLAHNVSQDVVPSSAALPFAARFTAAREEEPVVPLSTQSHQSHVVPASLSSTNTTQMPTSHTLVQAPSTPQLNAQLGSQEWQQGLSQHILLFNRQGQQSAELKLNPQDLGSIQISLKLDNDQAQLNMVSGHSQVRAALEAAIPHLRTALAESGISLGQSSVSSESSPQNSAFSGQQEQRQASQNGHFLTQTQDDTDASLAAPVSLQALATGRGGVDIFA